jgi:hypothetical protein
MDFTSNGFMVDAFGISGGHRMNGIFVAHDEAVRSGAATANAHITDVAPTLLHLLGQPVPEDMDGRVLTEILTDEFKGSNPVRIAHCSSERDGSRGGTDLTGDESSEIRDRLRELGYLG